MAKKDRFAGRLDQIIDITNALLQPGSHVVLYGERGVGKTSLTNVLDDFLKPLWPEGRVVRINCSTSDTFDSVWTKVFHALAIPVPESFERTAPDPDLIRSYLEESAAQSVIILDEYDRMEDDAGLSLMADTVKTLSDHDVSSKLVLVGVADSIDQLVGEHASVQRAFVEIAMPRMSRLELAEIIDGGLSLAGMTIGEAAKVRIGGLAEGLPHYVHLLSLVAAQTALKDDRDRIELNDVQAAIQSAIRTHSLVREYQNAVQSPRRDNLFPQVLTACALAEKNRLGYFTAASIKKPMSQIMGRPYDIPAFARHLSLFIESDRGPVLKREGLERRYTYRFINPLLQPFTILTAIAEGFLDESVIDPT